MLIWGWKTVFRVIGSGVFSCPSCGADRNYERRKAQRFFTLFFIPLIPLKVVGEFVRCTYCKNDFRDAVLSRPTAAQFTDLLQNTVRGVMVSILRRGGWDHPGARAAAVQEITTAGAVGYAEPNLAQDMQVVPEDLSQMLTALAGQLPETGREALVTGATRVAAADAPVTPAERAVIDSVGAALGLSQVHVAGIVAAVAPGADGGAPATGQAAAAPEPAWGTGQSTVPTPPPTPWGTGAQDAVPAAGGSGMETMMIQAPQPPQPSNMETAFIQAPQPAPATGAHDAQPSAARSAMETAFIPAPQPAPAESSATGSGMETMMIQAPQPPQPSNMETAFIQAPQPAPATGAHGAVPPADRQHAIPEPPPTLPEPPPNAMETMLIPAPPRQPSGVPVPPPTMVDTSSSMETMAIPLDQLRPPRAGDSADEPTHISRADDPTAWPPPHQQ